MTLHKLTQSRPFRPYSGQLPPLTDKDFEDDMFYLLADCSLTVLKLVLHDHHQRMADRAQRSAWVYGETP
jgi:hypothetical protein